MSSEELIAYCELVLFPHSIIKYIQSSLNLKSFEEADEVFLQTNIEDEENEGDESVSEEVVRKEISERKVKKKS